MKSLIVEDEFTSRLLLQKMLLPYGEAHIAVDGEEAVEAFRAALESGQPYDLVCMDIILPRIDGQTALRRIRESEAEFGVIGNGRARVIMVTAASDPQSVIKSHSLQCDSYLVKPIDKNRLIQEVSALGLTGEKAP